MYHRRLQLLYVSCNCCLVFLNSRQLLWPYPGLMNTGCGIFVVGGSWWIPCHHVPHGVHGTASLLTFICPKCFCVVLPPDTISVPNVGPELGASWLDPRSMPLSQNTTITITTATSMPVLRTSNLWPSHQGTPRDYLPFHKSRHLPRTSIQCFPILNWCLSRASPRFD